MISLPDVTCSYSSRVCLKNAIEQIKQTDNVRNFEHYLISALWVEANSGSFRENAEARNVEYSSN